MNIVLINKNPFYYKNKTFPIYLAGHVTGFVEPFTNYLLNKKHKVIMISPAEHSNFKGEYDAFFPEPPKSENFHQIFIKPKILPKVPFSFGELDVKMALMKASDKLGKIDVVISVYAFPWIIPVNDLKSKVGYKTVALLRGSDATMGCNPNSEYNEIYGKEEWEYITQIYRNSLNKSDLVITTSEMLAHYVRDLGVRVDGISPTPPFEYKGTNSLQKTVLKRRFLQTSAIRTQIYEIDIKKEWIIYLGRFHRDKQVDLMIRSFLEIRNKNKVHFLLCGLGEELDNLIKLSKKLHIKDISFCFVPPNLVPLLCRCATAMVHPASLPWHFIDARPSSCINAAYQGCPVILPFKENRNDFGGAHESVSPFNTKHLSYDPFLPRQTVSSLIAEKIDLVIENRYVKEEIGRKNEKWASQFTQIKEFKKLENRIKSLL